MKKINVMIYMALLISIEIVFTRFLAIETPIIRIGLGFLPIAVASIMFGPVLGGMVAAIADVMGMMIFPKGAYFPGFTLSAFTSGAIYGVLFYEKKVSIKRVIIAVAVITILVDMTMNTYWLTILTGKAGIALLVPRMAKSGIMFLVQVFLIYPLWKTVYKLDFIPKLNKA